MSLLTLELKNDSDLELFVAFARRMNIVVLDIKQTISENKQSPVYWLEQLANKGGVKSIPDPSDWQKEIRTDKKLFNRE